MKAVVLGLGYVGTVTLACLAEAGHTVVGVDPARGKVEAIAAGRSPVAEPGVAELIAANRSRISASSSASALTDADVAIVAVGTPSDEHGALDLRFVRQVAAEIGQQLVGRATPLSIIVRSTLLPGSTVRLFTRWVEEASNGDAGVDFHVAFCPEFLREASAVADFLAPPYTVIGVEHPGAAVAPRELFGFVDAPVHVVPTGVAESLKYASNSFHAMKVAFANELSRVLVGQDVDARQVMDLFVQDTQLNISPRYLRPGFAFGGSCLPKDVRALTSLSRASGVSVPLIDSILASNDAQVQRVVDLVTAAQVDHVAIIGLTFKPLTDDVRESPYLELAARLSRLGIELRLYDPVLRPDGLVGANLAHLQAVLPGIRSLLVDSVDAAVVDAGLAILATPQPTVVAALLRARPVPVIDLTGILTAGDEMELRTRSTPGPLDSYRGTAW